MSKKKREEIRTWFFENCKTRGWKYSIISCPPRRIDLAVENKGLNILETQLFAEAINKLALTDNNDGFMITNDACDVDVVVIYFVHYVSFHSTIFVICHQLCYL